MIGFLRRRWRARAARPNPEPLGPRGESAAAKHLRKQGYRIIARNVRRSIGEIDLVAESPGRDAVVVVEVKARMIEPGDDRQRLPERAITAAKARKLAGLARTLAKRPGLAGRRIRIDVVAVEFVRGRRRPVAVRHYPNAISAAGRRV